MDDVTGLTLDETLAVGAFLAAMQRSNVPVRRPSVNQPPYWGQGFVVNSVVPLPPTAGPDWITLLTVPVKQEYYAVITGFIISTLGSLDASGLLFRFLQDEEVMSNRVNLAAGVDLNRITPTTWPARVRPMRLVLPTASTFSMQYRNTALVDKYALCAITGYYAAAKDATVLDSGGITDA